jgi:hypothetical protein
MPKISELNAASNVATSDLLLVVKDPSGAPSTNKITTANFMTYATRMMAYANTTATGGIKVGNNLTINSTGYLSASANGAGLPTAGQDNGYVLQWSDADNSAVWSTLSAPLNFSLIYESNTYTATSEDYILFVDPNTYGNNIYIKFPAAPLIGKVYQVKNIDPGDGNKVVVCISNNSSILENPLTGEIQASFDITAKGDSQEWVYDGTYYRHIGSQTSLPFFSSEANTFTQIVLQNRSSGTNASGDVVVYSDAGDPNAGTGPFVDLGINSSQYSNGIYSIGGPNDAYLFNDGGDFAIGTAAVGGRLLLHVGGTTANTTKAIINAAGFFVNTSIIFADGSTQNTAYTGGATGYTGSQGAIGYTGSAGSTGSTGSAGSTGYTGSAGYTGSSGAITRTIQTVSVVGPTTISSSVVFGDPNAAGANVNLLLPSSPSDGSIYTVKNINSGGSVVYVQTNGVLNIENESGSIGSGVYATISASGDFITWIYDNSSTTYRIIG